MTVLVVVVLVFMAAGSVRIRGVLLARALLAHLPILVFVCLVGSLVDELIDCLFGELEIFDGVGESAMSFCQCSVFCLCEMSGR